jgi:hypothetical protein
MVVGVRVRKGFVDLRLPHNGAPTSVSFHHIKTSSLNGLYRTLPLILTVYIGVGEDFPGEFQFLRATHHHHGSHNQRQPANRAWQLANPPERCFAT